MVVGHNMKIILQGLRIRRFENQCVKGTNSGFVCSTSNKNPETDIGVQDQKSKTAMPLEKYYLYQRWATADLYSPLVLGLKTCDSLVLGLKV